VIRLFSALLPLYRLQDTIEAFPTHLRSPAPMVERVERGLGFGLFVFAHCSLSLLSVSEPNLTPTYPSSRETLCKSNTSITSSLHVTMSSNDGSPTKIAASNKREGDDLFNHESEDDFTQPPDTKSSRKKSKKARKKGTEADATAKVYSAELLPSPYFYYRDDSTEVDDDPLKPITSAGNVPCFPAKVSSEIIITAQLPCNRCLTFSFICSDL
jgi:hypothetical protein